MTRAKYIFRMVFFLLTVLLLVDLNRKTEGNTETIAEFKFKMFKKIQTDSLDAKSKMDLLINDTTKFIDDSSHVKEGIRYLTGILGLLIVVELGFFIRENRNTGQQGIK
jgi:hypothetical protein